jgi:SAM-dependent methyltransferase
MLQLAQITANLIDVKLTRSVLAIFEPDVKGATSGSFQDQQTLQLRQLINASDSPEGYPLRILDFGAGRGRTLLELSKNVPDKHTQMEWLFWEPQVALREELKTHLNDRNWPRIIVLDALAPEIVGDIDLVVIANVLHELPPPDAANVLFTARQCLRSGGKILIVELYPLIHPEKHAVPYRQTDLESILLQSGWKLESGSFPVRGGLVTAYFVVAHSPDQVRSLDKTAICRSIETAWDEILQYNCAIYDGRLALTSASDQVRLLSTLTTIASVMNYKLGQWVSAT